MTALLKQRLVGAIVLISLGIIFIPMLLTGKGELTTGELPTNIPAKPLYEIQAPAVLPLEQKTSSERSVEAVQETTVSAAPDAKTQMPKEPIAPVEDTSGSTASEKSEAAAPVTETAAKSESVAVTEPIEPERTQPIPAKQSVTKSGTPPPAEKVAIVSTKPPIVSGWVVQLGSFSVEKNALKLRDTLRKNGHASFVEAYEKGGKTSYRVRVGPELTRELAEQLKKQLKQDTKLEGLVIAFPG